MPLTSWPLHFSFHTALTKWTHLLSYLQPLSSPHWYHFSTCLEDVPTSQCCKTFEIEMPQVTQRTEVMVGSLLAQIFGDWTSVVGNSNKYKEYCGLVTWNLDDFSAFHLHGSSPESQAALPTEFQAGNIIEWSGQDERKMVSWFMFYLMQKRFVCILKHCRNPFPFHKERVLFHFSGKILPSWCIFCFPTLV